MFAVVYWTIFIPRLAPLRLKQTEGHERPSSGLQKFIVFSRRSFLTTAFTTTMTDGLMKLWVCPVWLFFNDTRSSRYRLFYTNMAYCIHHTQQIFGSPDTFCSQKSQYNTLLLFLVTIVMSDTIWLAYFTSSMSTRDMTQRWTFALLNSWFPTVLEV